MRLSSSDGDFNQVEETGGAKTHTLTIGRMPSYNHSYNEKVRHIQPSCTAGSNRYEPGVSNTEFDRTTGSRGSTQAHNNLQPYIVIKLWKNGIKILVILY